MPAAGAAPVRRLGIDVGGTKCLAVVIDETGAVVGEERRPTPHGPQAIVDAIVALVDECRPFTSIGVGVPGLVTRAGVLRAAPNLVDTTDFHVREMLGERLGVAVEVDNDATCAAVAEWTFGAARGSSDFVLVTLGTGIGGGIVAGGALQRGANGFTGEIGHMVVDPHGPPCPCGRNGCWERYASGSGLGRLAREVAGEGRLVRVVELAGGDVAAVRGEHVQAAAAEGDAAALAVINDYARWVALGLVNLTNILDPQMFVLGGGLATAGEMYLAPILRWMTQLLYAPELRPHPQVVFAEWGERAGAVGAALLPTVR